MINIIYIHEVCSASFYQDFLDYVFDLVRNIAVGVDIVTKGVLELRNGSKVGNEHGYTLFISLASISSRSIDDLYLFGPSVKPININQLDIREFRPGIEVSIAISDDPISLNEDHPCFLKKARCFKNEDNLLKYLDQVDFRFPDGSKFRPYQYSEKKKKK